MKKSTQFYIASFFVLAILAFLYWFFVINRVTVTVWQDTGRMPNHRFYILPDVALPKKDIGPLRPLSFTSDKTDENYPGSSESRFLDMSNEAILEKAGVDAKLKAFALECCAIKGLREVFITPKGAYFRLSRDNGTWEPDEYEPQRLAVDAPISIALTHLYKSRPVQIVHHDVGEFGLAVEVDKLHPVGPP